jgi:molybdopterin synthase catalytic subunit
VHRLGRVDPGEASVAIVVAAPRRGPAFEASRYTIERIKEVVPIWKREVWSDGYVWVGSQVGTRDQV